MAGKQHCRRLGHLGLSVSTPSACLSLMYPVANAHGLHQYFPDHLVRRNNRRYIIIVGATFFLTCNAKMVVVAHQEYDAMFMVAVYVGTTGDIALAVCTVWVVFNRLSGNCGCF